MPPLQQTTLQRIALLFAPAEQQEVADVLESQCGSGLPGCKWIGEIERVRIAVLRISKGDSAKLHTAIELATRDYRDVLMCAGFGEDILAHLKWWPDKKRT